MKTQQLRISATDGYQLAAIVREPESEPKGVVQFHGGTGIPQTFYGNLAAYLTENGYVTITFDYRGIGSSKPPSLKGFEATTRDWGQLDMTGVFDWVLHTYPTKKKIVIGHSMGGQLVGLMPNSDKIDQLFLIASATGYWKDMSSPLKWLLPSIWYFFIPLTTAVYGYAHAKKIRQGENLPKGVALEWRKWCINPTYFEPDFGKTLHPLYYDQVKISLTSIQLADDPIANQVTATKILTYYSHAQLTIDRIVPSEIGVAKIGHMGYFSRRMKDKLWVKLLAAL